MPKYARVLLFALLALAGCGNTTIIFVTISPSTQSLDSGQSVTITATVMIIGWLGHRGTGKQHACKRRGNQQSGHGLYPFRYPTG